MDTNIGMKDSELMMTEKVTTEKSAASNALHKPNMLLSSHQSNDLMAILPSLKAGSHDYVDEVQKEPSYELQDNLQKLRFMRKDKDNLYSKSKSRGEFVEEIRKKAFSRLTAHPLSHRSTGWSKMSLRSPKNTSGAENTLGSEFATFGQAGKPSIRFEDDSTLI